jgi:predicted metal-dependent hydrolase
VNLFRPRIAFEPDSVIEVAGAPVRLKVNGRARRISLRIDARRGEVVATAPSARRLGEAVGFAQSRAAWIAQRLAAVPELKPLRPGVAIKVGGAPCRLERAAMRITPRLIPATPDEPMRLLASGEDDAYGRAALRALKAEALARLTARTAHHAAMLGQSMPSVAVADAKGRWGSCRAGGRGRPAAIRYSWRLILAPAEVLDYVAAHEVAHLVEANHGEGFWRIVHTLYGDHQSARRWLRTNGAEIQAISA